jgi:pilus assembly protein CpaE
MGSSKAHAPTSPAAVTGAQTSCCSRFTVTARAAERRQSSGDTHRKALAVLQECNAGGASSCEKHGNPAICAQCSRMALRLPETDRVIITFLGTKGGTGTTTIAVNCAADVHRLSHRSTVVVDAKQSPGDVAVFLGVRPRYSIVELIDQMGWAQRTHAQRYMTEHDSGLHVLAASEGFGRPNSRDVEGVERAIACCASLYDYVVIDAGSTLSSSAVAALTAADLVVLVANPDLPCLRNLRRLSDAVRLAGVAPERTRVLLNRTSDQGTLALTHIERVVGRPMDFQLTSDYRTVAAALNTGVPVSRLRTTELQQQLESMARTLIGIHQAAAAS